jgi:hypothetical protein
MGRGLTLALALALILGSACNSDDGFVPTNPEGPSIPSIGGTYTSNTMWRFELTRASDGVQNLVICGGTFTVGTQVGTTFTGSWQLLDPACASLSGRVTDGTFTSTGAVTFGLSSGASDPNFLISAFACTYVSGDMVLTGTISANQLNAQSSTVLDCPQQGGRNTLAVRVTGAR